MTNYIEKIEEFHAAFEVPTPSEQYSVSNNTPLEREILAQHLGAFAEQMKLLAQNLHNAAKTTSNSRPLLRLQLIQEELGELAKAMAESDKLETLDALVDLQYVLSGTILSLGYAPVFNVAFEEVHRSNMSKLDDEGKPLKDAAGRILKSWNYQPPELTKFIQ